MGLFRGLPNLLDSDFSAANAAATESANFAGGHLDDAVASSVDSEVAADLGADTRALGHANLADDNLTSFNSLAAKQLNTKALTNAISSIFGGTAGFDV